MDADNAVAKNHRNLKTAWTQNESPVPLVSGSGYPEEARTKRYNRNAFRLRSMLLVDGGKIATKAKQVVLLRLEPSDLAPHVGLSSSPSYPPQPSPLAGVNPTLSQL